MQIKKKSQLENLDQEVEKKWNWHRSEVVLQLGVIKNLDFYTITTSIV